MSTSKIIKLIVDNVKSIGKIGDRRQKMLTYFRIVYNMNNKEIRWAMSHDWYLYTGRRMTDNVNIVYVKDDMIKGKTLSFDNFEDLKTWANY